MKRSGAQSVAPIATPLIDWRGWGFGLNSSQGIASGVLTAGAPVAPSATSGGTNGAAAHADGAALAIANPVGDSSTVVATINPSALKAIDAITPIEYSIEALLSMSNIQAGSAALFGIGNMGGVLRGAGAAFTSMFLGITAEKNVSGDNWWIRSKFTTLNGWAQSIDTGIPSNQELRCRIVRSNGPSEIAARVEINGIVRLRLTGTEVPGIASPGTTTFSAMMAFGTSPAATLTIRRVRNIIKSLAAAP